MDEEIILMLSQEELYKLFIAKSTDLISEGFITEEHIDAVRYGINLKFSLSRYFQYKNSEQIGIFRRKPKQQEINCDGQGYVKMDKFNEELEDRQSIMINALLEYYKKDDDIIKPDLEEDKYGN